MEQYYEVLYIDKFTDAASAAHTRENLRKMFRLSERHLYHLSCGKPVVIKKKVSLDEAVRYRRKIEEAGGIAWVQALDEYGSHSERRQHNRRQQPDRRARYRASSIMPDRRESCGRRSTDGMTFH